ncbi:MULTISPECIES: SpvB/TcaC N-terminal domain-containing protein [Chryseobacterium]|uniref:RHS repeat-associated protein n=1 Tax=Chryseobacterium geocarposphaerae TaxID=1416776 RepID=A0ABU1LGM1_9FLAO|nr:MULTISPECIES: SpvB/TcaC N-terminal domain-containing protein [Chryseobacterium]MDR6405866.1 RHS repeat-associated protein [Chryseobacterium geocarposphaerae]MDR6698970.1 RHS repeat-associated protein [Chryseobacterium ginsenosidimutans]
MKNQNLFFILFFLLTNIVLFKSQEIINIPLEYNISGYIENKTGASSLTQKVLTPEEILTPSIKAEMNVNETGALTYTLPIEINKGVNDFQPNIALAYNSQSGNGMAGSGWNIVGLSTISRGGKSKEIDGITIGPQFDDADPFYLDGQRLIKIDANTFVTERFSKVKITKANSGDYQFIIQYTDGKVAKYKELISGQYYISLFQDSSENIIKYTYQVENSVPRITKISYGGANDPFNINFEYKSRKTPTEAYRNGVKFINNYVLSSVYSSSIYDGIFRKYILTHDFINSDTVERVRQIDVENKSGVKLKPLEFDYNLGITTGTIEKNIQTNAGFLSNTKELGDIVAGDFYGQGKLSTCYISKNVDGSFSLINSSYGNLPITVEAGAKLIVGKTLTTGNTISERDQLIIAHTGLFAKLQIVDLLTLNSRTLDTAFQDNGTWHWDVVTGQYTLDLSKSSDNYISGDFNNDGLTDLIHFIPAGTYNPAEVRMFEIGKTLGSSTTTIPFSLPNAQFFHFDRMYQLEMDGDGIPELMFIDGDKYSVYKIDNVNKALVPMNNLQGITLPDFTNNIYTKRFTPLIFGDFNGDGLTDFMTPKKIYYIDTDNSAGDVAKKMESESQMWWQYISTGKNFISTTKDYTAQKLSYIVPSQRNYFKAGGSFWKLLWSGPEPVYDYSEYGATTIIPTDFNNDGKTDLISFSKFGKVKYSDTQKLSLAEIQNMDVIYIDSSTGLPKPKAALYTNKIFLHENKTDTQGNNIFATLDTVLPLNADQISPFAIPLESTDFNQLNTYKSSLIISDPLTKRDISFTINNDKFTEKLIKKVSNGSGVDQLAEYRPMVTDLNSNTERCYITKINDWEFKYPYYIHKNNGTTYLANKIHTIFDTKILTQEYRFENALQHLEGRGFIGFQKTYVSDVYESEVKNGKYVNKNPIKAVFWTITTKNPMLDNTIISTTYGGINKFFTENIISIDRFEKGNHQYLILSTEEKSRDYLKKITISKQYQYDQADDYKLKTIYTDFSGAGSSISKYTYKPEFFNGDHYFYGKIASIENTTYKDGLSFITKNESDYYPTGNVSEVRKFGNQTSAPPVITQYTYDSFGNIKTETSATVGVTSQTISYEYEPTNRFVTKTITPDGLFSTAVINTLGQTTSETSSLGLVTSYNFDIWGNIIEITDFLGKKTTISKSVADAATGGVYNLHKKREGGVESIVTFDKFDKEIIIKTQSINGKWLVSKKEYDIFGKEVKISEPHFEGEPAKWNTIEYDELNRPIKNIAFTGKVITTCYEGMKVTVDDGYKKTSKTLDAMGHTIRQQDHGGVIAYSYYPNGVPKETNYEGIKTTFEIDGWGNKTKMTDPSAGMFTYEYDNLGRLTKETNPKGYTLFAYDVLGRPLSEKTYGNTTAENTNIEKVFTYNGQTKLPETITGTSNGKTFTYTTYYDQYYRIIGKKEETPDFVYSSNTTFDSFGRADIVSISTIVSNYTSNSAIKNVYDSNGLLIQQNDNENGNMVWHLSDINAKGQTTQMEYGNGYTVTNQYNPNDFSLFNIKHQNTNNGLVALDIDYNYDVNKGVLNWRRNNAFGKKEDFTYDKLNRLLTEAVNGVLANEYTYDKRGRITSNTELGKYNYNETNYKLQGIDFNTNGQNVNTQRGFAAITYNAFKSPNTIILAGKDNLSFDYNILKTRYSMKSSVTGKTKFYSADFAVEISRKAGKYGGTMEIITYITGDPYSANYIKKEAFSNGALIEKNNYYLHRDNLGSILAISKADGSVVEKRFFDAWGNLKALFTGSGVLITDTQELASGNMFLDRGYTGHEHLWKVGLINMNARLYDPVMRKFLSPDNLVQDPANTQSYDRFGYAYNNPLLYVDIDGNEPITLGLAIVIGVAVAITTKVIINAIDGVPVWYGLGKSAVTGAVMGAISFGIGSAATSATAGFIGKAALQAGLHGMTGGMMSALETGNFGSGFLSGAVSSIISSGIQALGTNFSGSGAMQDANHNYISMNSFGNSDLIKATMLVAGGLSGGLSSTIAGGKFMDGFKQGIITSGLNHMAHLVTDAIDQRITRQRSLQRIKAQYPRFYEVLTKLQDFLQANPKVLSSLSQETGLTKAQVLKFMDIKSPEGQVILESQEADRVGYLGYSSRDRSYISKNLLTTFQGLQTKEYIQGTSFLLAITVLHEFVHWGRVYNILKSDAPSNKWGVSDYGSYWELKTFGMTTGRNQETINLSYQYGWKF